MVWQEAQTFQSWGDALRAGADRRAAINTPDMAIEIYRQHGASQGPIQGVEGDLARSNGGNGASGSKTGSLRAPASSRAVFRREGAQEDSRKVAQIVALDECDPQTFNPTLGEEGTGSCHNVTLYGLHLGFETPLDTLVGEANSGTPDPGWDFEPDQLTIQKGTTLSVVDQGGEPHTFTEVAHFGGGFVPALNHGEDTVPECVGGFKNVAVAKTRILQGSRLDVTRLSIEGQASLPMLHTWMHMEVDVK
jgi:hypothetical protein